MRNVIQMAVKTFFPKNFQKTLQHLSKQILALGFNPLPSPLTILVMRLNQLCVFQINLRLLQVLFLTLWV